LEPFLPFVESIFQLLFQLLHDTSLFDSKLKVLEVLKTLIEGLGDKVQFSLSLSLSLPPSLSPTLRWRLNSHIREWIVFIYRLSKSDTRHYHFSHFICVLMCISDIRFVLLLHNYLTLFPIFGRSPKTKNTLTSKLQLLNRWLL
jgi:hypothetical protein